MPSVFLTLIDQQGSGRFCWKNRAYIFKHDQHPIWETCLKLQFGLCLAPALFHRKIQQTFHISTRLCFDLEEKKVFKCHGLSPDMS